MPVLAIYDIRGIQDYIFRTPKISTAMGASRLVENLLKESLQNAVEKSNITNYKLEWYSEKCPTEFDGNQDVEVIYVGGGNEVVLFRSEELCKQVTKYMARYIIEKTYSLQLSTHSPLF